MATGESIHHSPNFLHHHHHNLPHVRQRLEWDCGIACVLMLLNEDQRTDFLVNFSKICLEEGLIESTWTIDLCHLLKRYNIQHCMCTLRIGINFSSHTNYNKVSEKDIKRVSERLENSSLDGLKIIARDLSSNDLVHHVQNYGPAIVLVDSRLLACDWCKSNKLTSEIRGVLGGKYRGHYVIVVGQLNNKVLYRDPARPHATCATTTRRLAVARHSPGTDRDVILVYKDYRLK